MQKTFIFDFDGTLVDSMPVFVGAIYNILDKYKVPYTEEIVKILTPLGGQAGAEYMRKMGVPITTEQVLELMFEYMVKEYEHNVLAKEGVIETLKQMKERGYSLNVLTASPHLTLDPCLKRLKIFDIFDNVWSCDDFNTTKANPEIYAQASKLLKKSVEQVIFVDDNFNACATAKKAGMKVYGIFDKSSQDYVEEIKSVADGYAYKFSELLEV